MKAISSTIPSVVLLEPKVRQREQGMPAESLNNLGLHSIGPASADRSEGLPIENRQFPIENPVVVVESEDFRCF